MLPAAPGHRSSLVAAGSRSQGQLTNPEQVARQRPPSAEGRAQRAGHGEQGPRHRDRAAHPTAAHRGLTPTSTAGTTADNPGTKLTFARITSTLNRVRDAGRLLFPFLPSFAEELTSLHCLFPLH